MSKKQDNAFVTVKYLPRMGKVWDLMAQEGIAMIVLEDTEGRRDPNIRWLTGQPGDSLLFFTADRKAMLVAWDINMAKLYARVEGNALIIAAYSDFDRALHKAVKGVAEKLGVPKGGKIEIPSATSYPSFLELVSELPDHDIICRKQGASEAIKRFRAVKDAEEIKIYRQAAAITNDLIDLIEKKVRSGKIQTEADIAMLLEIETRKRGCEGVGFETIAAGPDRSFGIHAFPAWTVAPFGGQGFSILDFGVKYCSYTTDATMTFARDPNPKQEKIIALVEKAYKLAVSLSVNGASARAVAVAVNELFEKSKKAMPHGLGHGVGVETHEYPALGARADNEWILEPGMVFTIEPGLYDPIIGGCRLENDVLMTETSAEVLTNSRIVKL
jgi:Xaa-Pro dipeptidase